MDGESALGHQGPSLSLGLGWASLDVSLFANAGIPVQLESAYATLRLARYVLGARTSYRLAVSRRLDLDLGVRAGWVVYHRSTEPNQPNVTPTSARDLAAAMVGIELGLELYPTDSDWAFVLLGGVDALPKVPRIVYQRDEEPIEAARPTILQPHLGIALRLGGRRSFASPR